MAKVTIHNMTGVPAGELELNDSVFSVEPNTIVMQETVLAHMANQRQGTASTKRRDEVRGGGKKPWRQKGTGRARAGSTRSPVWVGGGSVFGPKPRKYTQDMPKKKKQLALRSALAEKLSAGDLLILDKIELTEIKTKSMIELLRNFKISGKSLIVLSKADDKIERSVRNIQDIKLCTTENINIYDLIRFNKIIFDKAAIEKIQLTLTGNGK